MGGKSEPVGRAATKEQTRFAQNTQDGQDEDRSRIQKTLKEIVEMTRCTQAQAELALHDADYNVELAVDRLLEGSAPESWVHQKSRKGKKQNGTDEREDVARKGGKGQFRDRPPRVPNQNGVKTGRENVQRENIQREPREVREVRRSQQNYRPTRRQFDKPRTPFQPTDNKIIDKADEGDDLWKNSTTPLVFNRRELPTKPAIEEVPVLESTAPTHKPCAAGPMSFAAIVAMPAKKDLPKPVPPPSPVKKSIPEPEIKQNQIEEHFEKDLPLHESMGSERMDENQPSASHISISQNTSMGFGSTSTSVDQSLTDKLKNDLGLGISTDHNNRRSLSPQKKTQDSRHVRLQQQQRPVEFVSGDAPFAASNYNFVFSFEAVQNNASSEHDNNSTFAEPQRPVEVKETNHVSTIDTNMQNNVPASINQYQQQQQQQQQTSFRQPQTNQANNHYRSRYSNLGNNLSFCDANTINYHPPDMRQQNGAPQSPTKTQPVQPQHVSAPMPQPHQQQSHPPHQQMFPSAAHMPYNNFPYMYSPVTPAGIRDDYATSLLQLQQFTMGQMDGNSPVMPPLAVTSAGPLPNVQNHHHQSHQNQQLQNNQRDHYDMGKFQNNQMNPSSQNNVSNNQSSRSTGNMNQGQQRQPMLDNGSQAAISGAAVAPPPGFSAPAQFIPQPNISSLFQSFQMPGYPLSFPFMVPPQPRDGAR